MIRHTARRILLAIALCTMLTACADDDAPVRVYQYGVSGGAATDLGMRTVEAGDTPYTIAKAYDIAPEDIIAVNNLSPPYRLAPGQRLRIPPPSRYVTHKGDTLYSVSRTFNVSETQIAQLNHLPAPYTLPPDTRLRLPSVLPAPEIASAAPPDNAAISTAPTSATAMAPGHVYNPPPPVIQYYARPAHTAAGAGTGMPPETTPSETAPADTQTATRPAVVASSPASRSSASSDAAAPTEEAKTANGDTLIADSETPAASAQPEKPGTFSRPVAGPIISGYGDKPNGLHNDGINIKAASGTPVHAAAGGEIVYASDQLKGFGNLVLIRHQDRWLTAYAHLGTLKVQKGDTVRRGQVIGTVGQTGGVDGPQLHFEIRRGTAALNPVGFLTPSS